MVNQDLQGYIAQSRQQGVSDEQIKQTLLGSGWPELDIDQALTPASPIVNGDGWYRGLIKNKLFATVIVVLIVGAAGTACWFLYRGQSDELIKTEVPETLGTGQEPKTSPVVGQPQLSFQKPKGTISAAPGEIISIELYGPGIAEVLLFGPEFADSKEADESNIFMFQYRVPLEAIGSIKLGALGKTKDKLLVPSDDLNINISLTSAGKIISIREVTAPNETVVLSVGSTWSLRVLATFSDGVERDITSDPGTAYVLYPGQPLNTEIIRVDNRGEVTAVSKGQRSLGISNRGSTTSLASVTVIVE